MSGVRTLKEVEEFITSDRTLGGELFLLMGNPARLSWMPSIDDEDPDGGTAGWSELGPTFGRLGEMKSR